MVRCVTVIGDMRCGSDQVRRRGLTGHFLGIDGFIHCSLFLVVFEKRSFV